MDKFYPIIYAMPVPPPVSTYTFYDCLVVVDFEATCDDTRNNSEQLRPLRSEMPEIIQFPATLIDVRQMAIVDCFDCIVKPVELPVLSEFCTSLTGITQSMVDKALPFPKVLRKFEKWLRKHGLNNNGHGRTFALVADGSYDMGHFLYKQSLVSGVPFPTYAQRWVNIRTTFSKFYGHRWFSLKQVLDLMGQPFEGRQHNGLDDAKNIAKVMLRLLIDGCIVTQTEMIITDPEEQEKNELRILNDKRAGKYDLATVKPIFGQECIYVMPPNVLYRRPPPESETDLYPNMTKFENKENLPSKLSKKGLNEKRTNSKNRKKATRPDYSSVLQGSTPAKCGKAAEGLELTAVIPDEE